jgi:hypothetical protein
MTAVWSFLLLENFPFLIVSYINAYKDRVTHAQTRCSILVEGVVWNRFSCLTFSHHSSVTLHVLNHQSRICNLYFVTSSTNVSDFNSWNQHNLSNLCSKCEITNYAKNVGTPHSQHTDIESMPEENTD